MKVGILGGAFNPPHSEHINMAYKALEAGLDKVVFVPSNLPPHKVCDVPFDQRTDMLALAVGERKDMEICPIEGADSRVHCTYETLPVLKKIYGDVVFLIGGDSLIDLHTWRNPAQVVGVCPIWAFDRADRRKEFDAALEYWRAAGARIRVMDYHPEDVSSTRIRYRLEYRDMRDIDPKVGEYIVAHGLYHTYDPWLQCLRRDLYPDRYEHTLRTSDCAIDLNAVCRLALDPDRVFTAAILHDCAKSAVRNDDFGGKIPEDSIGTPIEHQFGGAVVAREEYGVQDEEILNAVRYHSTGRIGMSALEKLIYLSDLLESGRDFDGVDELRALTRADFETGFRACLQRQFDHLQSKGKPIYPLGIAAYEHYCH